MNRSVLLGILVSLVASLVGCHPSAVPPTAVAPGDPAAVGPATTPQVVARPGEQATYKITIHGIEVAQLVVSVGQPTTIDGAEVIIAQCHVTSAKLLGWVHPLNDTLTSWIDRTTGQPVRYRSIELASRDGDDFEDSESRFAPKSFGVHVLRRGKVIDETQVVRDIAYDIPSMLTLLRSWEAEPGSRRSFDVMRSRNAWRVNIVVGAFENLSTPLGDMATVRFDGDGVRIFRDGTEDPKGDHRKFSIWVSDDADRVPARMVARTDYGDVDVQIVAYRAQ